MSADLSKFENRSDKQRGTARAKEFGEFLATADLAAARAIL